MSQANMRHVRNYVGLYQYQKASCKSIPAPGLMAMSCVRVGAPGSVIEIMHLIVVMNQFSIFGAFNKLSRSRSFLYSLMFDLLSLNCKLLFFYLVLPV